MPKTQEASTAGPDEFIRAVHYFGEQWPLNFWSSFTKANVPRDFAQIRDDGFNCVILLLPMRMFLPGTGPVTKEYENRLLFLLSEARKIGLGIILRVGYPHDICPSNTGLAPRIAVQLCNLLHQSDETYRRYLDHLRHVKSLVASWDNIKFVFQSWEDSWCIMKSFPDLELAKRKMLSKRLGFDSFLRSNLSEDMRKFLAIADAEIVPIPNKDDPLFAFFKQFYDSYTYDRFIAPLESLFPNAAYEQRVDSQKVADYKGGTQWLQFDGYREKKAACFSYWAPFMGQENVGEAVGAEAALQALRRVESRVRAKAGRRHFIDQFNFVNGTAEFTATSAKIDPAERTEFLAAALDYLKETVLGYGLWAYRDYRENILVNGTFELGSYNWNIEGAARIVGEGPYWVAVEGPCRLRTKAFAGRRFTEFRGHYGPFRLSFELDRPLPDEAACNRIAMTVRIFGRDYPIRLVPGSLRQSALIEFDCAARTEFGTPLEIRINVPSGAALAVRDFQFFNHVLSNGLYSVENESSLSMDAIRRFNISVSAASQAVF